MAKPNRADYGLGMRNKLSNLMVAVALGSVVGAGALTSCDDDDDNNQTTGIGGRGGSTGAAGTSGGGGSGGGSGVATFNMRPDSSQEVPPNNSPATANVMVTLNRTTGDVSVDGTFEGLTSMVTAAHIHGPATVGMNGPIIVPLAVTGTTSGTVTGTATMTAPNMNDMINGMTYVNIHSQVYPEGEIRAQIVP